MNGPTAPNPAEEARVRRVLEERAQALAARGEAARVEGLELLVFSLSGERYALETRAIREVSPFTDFTMVPDASPWLLGVTNLRGEILPVFDLRRLAGLAPKGLTDLSRLLVLGEEGRPELGLLADEVREVRRVPQTGIFTPPDELTFAGRALLRGVTEDGVLILDEEAILRDPRLHAARAQAGGEQ